MGGVSLGGRVAHPIGVKGAFLKLCCRFMEFNMERNRGCNNGSREMGELATRVDMLSDRIDMLLQDRSETYRRVGTLESRMAQVTLIAGMAALILPAILTFFVKH